MSAVLSHVEWVLRSVEALPCGPHVLRQLADHVLRRTNDGEMWWVGNSDRRYLFRMPILATVGRYQIQEVGLSSSLFEMRRTGEHRLFTLWRFYWNCKSKDTVDEGKLFFAITREQFGEVGRVVMGNLLRREVRLVPGALSLEEAPEDRRDYPGQPGDPKRASYLGGAMENCLYLAALIWHHRTLSESPCDIRYLVPIVHLKWNGVRSEPWDPTFAERDEGGKVGG